MEFPWSEPSITPEQFLELGEAILPASLLTEVLDLVPAGTLARFLPNYILSPVLRLERSKVTGIRVCVSNVGGKEEWRSAVRRHWADATVEEFLDKAPPSTRRMIELGDPKPTFYLDDLHEVSSAERSWKGELLCMRLNTNTGELQSMTRHDVLSEIQWSPLLDACGIARELLPSQGLWGMVRDPGSPTAQSLLFITETQTRTSIRESREFLRHSAAGAAVSKLMKQCDSLGLRVYLDSLELHENGATDVTLGFLGPA